MATYDYRCPECGDTYSHRASFAEYEASGQLGFVCDKHDEPVNMKRVYGGIRVSIPSTFHD